MPKRVLIADDNRLVRRAIRTLLANWSDVEVCAETDDGSKTLDKALALKPDFLILDVRMPELNGIEVASILKKTLPAAKMILFTMYSDNVGTRLAAAAGVHVVLAKVDGLPALISALDTLLGGGSRSGSVSAAS
jgi:DNA-binding NarL/FixJ family response regulator